MRVAINGLGRIGRNILKIALENNIDVVAVNDLCDSKTITHLLKYDSIYGRYSKKIEYGKDFIKIDNKKIKLLSESNPSKLPWKELKVDIVVESTGRFRGKEDAMQHIKNGAKKVILSAPGKNIDITVVLGVNQKELKKEHRIISMASCTTNCLAPIAMILNDNFGIEKGFMTTVHGYTNDQRLHDSPHSDLRRARAAALNIIPTTTGATQSVIEAIPELKGKLNGVAMRVPVACGSIVDFVCVLNKKATKEQINSILKKYSNGEMKGILEYTEDEIVSSDVIRNPNSSIVDGLSTQVIGNMVKILSWYDNEYGYSTRMVDLLKLINQKKLF